MQNPGLSILASSVSPSKAEIRMASPQYPGACLSQALLRANSKLVHKGRKSALRLAGSPGAGKQGFSSGPSLVIWDELVELQQAVGVGNEE